MKRAALTLLLTTFAAYAILSFGQPFRHLAEAMLLSLVWLVTVGMLERANAPEGAYLDLWSIPHLIFGLIFGLLLLPVIPTLVIIVVWEIIEEISGSKERVTNHIFDVLVGLAGWVTACSVISWLG